MGIPPNHPFYIIVINRILHKPGYPHDLVRQPPFGLVPLSTFLTPDGRLLVLWTTLRRGRDRTRRAQKVPLLENHRKIHERTTIRDW